MDFTKLNDNFDSVTKFDSDMMLAEDESGIKWEKSVEKTISGNGKIEFQGNRNRPIKSFFLEGFCQQDGTPSPDNPVPINVNDSVWVSSGVNIYNKNAAKITTLADFLNVKKPMPCAANLAGSNSDVGNKINFTNGCNAIAIPCRKGDSFTLAMFGSYVSARQFYTETDSTGTVLVKSSFALATSSYTFTATSGNCAFLAIEWSIDNPDNAQIVVTRGSTVPSQYEPYIDGGSVDLSSIKLAGVGNVKDTYDSQTGMVARHFVEVDLGSFPWDRREGYISVPIFYTMPINDRKKGGSLYLCEKFVPKTNRTLIDGDNQFSTVNQVADTGLVFRCDSYTDVASFKAAMTGTKLIYELAEPVTETLTPQPITQRKGTNTITQVSGSVEDTAATAKIYGFPYESVSLKFAQHAVDSHIAKDLLPIGAELSDTWRTYDAPWRVVHHYPTGNAMALEWKWATPDGEVFDEPEAIYYAAEGLAAGTYNITIGLNMGAGWVKDQSIQFTLAKAVPAGGQICIDCGKNQANNPTDGRTLTVYTTKGGTTVNETTTTSNGTQGTNLGSTSTANVGRTNGYVNAPQRVVYGYNRWSQSSKRQWLNATGNKNTWWTAQNYWDRPPAKAATKPGFLHDASANLLSALKPVKVVTALNTAEGFSETYEITEDKIFLPSLQEMYVNPQLANVEGEDWLYYKRLAEENGLAGRIPINTNFDWIKKYRIDSHNTSTRFFLRSAYLAYSSHTWIVNQAGRVERDYGTASFDWASCPACILHDGTYRPAVPT